MTCNCSKNVEVGFVRLRKEAIVPTYAKSGDCCCDLYAVEDVIVPHMSRRLIDTGIAIELPEGFEAQIRPRSGNAWKKGITVLNSPGTVDEGYRDSLKVILINLGDDHFKVNKGDRIAQMKIAPVYKAVFVEKLELSSSERGTGGLGSTGK